MTFSSEQLGLQPPGSFLEWRIFDDGFIADAYRIVLLGPRQWLVSGDGRDVGVYRSLRTAFSSAEHDYREALRRRSVRRNALIAALAVIAWLAVDALFGVVGAGLWIVVLFPIVLVGMLALVRCLAGLSGNVHNPYLSIPYDPRSLWTRSRVRERGPIGGSRRTRSP
jgi:hypothetical protein